jgi:hypothetical protein
VIRSSHHHRVRKYHFDSRWEIISHLSIWTEVKVWKQFYFLFGQNWITKIHRLWCDRYMYRLKLCFSLKCMCIHKDYQLIGKLSTEWILYVEYTWCPKCERIKKQLEDGECRWEWNASSFSFTIRTYPANENKYSSKKGLLSLIKNYELFTQTFNHEKEMKRWCAMVIKVTHAWLQWRT